MPRYVILRHELPPGNQRASHYDVMFDTGETLRTWAIDATARRCRDEQSAEQLPDHRRDYLTYEGPVSGNRGSVTRWDEGEYEMQADDDAAFVVEVRGNRLSGTIRITADGTVRSHNVAGTVRVPSAALPFSNDPERRFAILPHQARPITSRDPDTARGACLLRQNLLRDDAAGFGQAEVAAGVAERERFVVEAEQVQDRGVQIVHAHDSFDGRRAEFVGRAVTDSLPSRRRRPSTS